MIIFILFVIHRFHCFDETLSSVSGGKTLLIINGLKRTMDIAILSVLQNVVRENLPCDVIVAMDAADAYGEKLVELLKPYLLPRPYTSNPVCLHNPCAHIEFLHTYEALKHVLALDSYAYIAHVRTDTLVNTPFCFACVYGTAEHALFALKYESFSLRMRKRLRDEHLTRQHLLYYYVAGGGSDLFAYTSLHDTRTAHCPPSMPHCEPRSPWCFAGVDVCIVRHQTAAIREYIETLDTAYLESLQNVQREVQYIDQRFKILYLAGSTWFQFGPADRMLEQMRSIVEHWGKTFAQVFPHTAARKDFDETYVTESQIRLSVWAKQATLIELHNMRDYVLSFSNELVTVDQLFMNHDVGVMLLRDQYVPHDLVLK